jgi:drug/metabolite transporter (DMT)-like permease
MWSIAGVVTRHLESAQSFEVTFWRSVFTVLSLLLILPITQGVGVFQRLLIAPRVVWFSGVCWAFMFTSFMMALTLTTVAEVLITMSIGPLVTALIARVFLKHHIASRTWLAIAMAGVGMAWMFSEPSTKDAATPWGTWVALLVPISAAINWTLVQRAQDAHACAPDTQPVELIPAVMVGALLSALATLPFAMPFQATQTDVAWLALLGLVQLAIPCALVVVCARVLPAPEISLLALLEVLFGIALAWVGAGEEPNARVLSGGSLVLLGLLLNEWLASRASHEEQLVHRDSKEM